MHLVVTHLNLSRQILAASFKRTYLIFKLVVFQLNLW